MAWELDDRDKMVIRFLVFCKREKFSKPSSGLQGLKTKFLSFSLEVPLIALVIARCSVILNRF